MTTITGSLCSVIVSPFANYLGARDAITGTGQFAPSHGAFRDT